MSDECARCGAVVPSGEWHPVKTVRDDEGRVVIHDFCCEACRSAWLAERNADD
ncbi:hypothetical protein [Halorussus sp. MSC15.2]|uniref:DUF7576 family protein n=1 Tax=Halorussus sp. MSC15.2 TaxID=2283638 RepID=UPI0013D874F1|nr:hypothetical protein [Halorussus sp. MSC15.2]NEU56705.1 hypothetical protein [Halorussus sp. MSC15.2]